MPIYEYRCDACEHQCEILQKISDEPEKFCPHCGKEQFKKLISKAAFHLKGTGWYVTDFKDKDKPKKSEDKKDNKDKSAEGKTSDTKSDAKQDNKATKPKNKQTDQSVKSET